MEAVDLLIKNGVPKYNEHIECAVLSGFSQIVKRLINKSQINVNTKLMFNLSPLHLVAKHCDTSVVKYLISKGIDVNAKDSNDILPIECATTGEKGPTVEVLLQNGSDVGKSLHIAAENDYYDIIYILLEYGADVNGVDVDGSPLHYAIRYGNQTCISLLLENENINVNFCGRNQFTPLHVAAQVGDLEVTKTLINMGADVNALNKDNIKPIHTALLKGNIDILKYFIDNNYNKIDEITVDGRTLLHYAAGRTNTEIINYLVLKKLNINAADYNNETPLHTAAAHSTREICNILIENGAIYNSEGTEDCSTPYEIANHKTRSYFSLIHKLFHYVYSNDNFKVSKLIENNQSDINLNAINVNGKSVLHISILEGYDSIVNTLLKFNANLNIKDFEFDTPLHYASKLNKKEIVSDLLSNGAIYNLKNMNGNSPFDLSTNCEIKSLLNIIDKYFKYVEENNVEFLNLLKNVKNHEDLKKILFGPRNHFDQDLYTYITVTNATDFKEKLKNILNRDIQHELKRSEILACQEKYDEAYNLLSKITTEYEEFYGPNNPVTLKVQSKLLTVLYKLAKYEKSLSINEKIIQTQVKLYGEDNEVVLKSRSFSGLILYRLGKNNEAIKIFEDVCKKQVNLLGLKHDDVLNTKGYMALVLHSLKRYEEALNFNQETYIIRKRLLGENNPSTLVEANNIAMVLNSQGKYNETIERYQYVYNKRSQVLGIHHCDTLSSLYNMADILSKLKKYDIALAKLTAVYEMQKISQGESHKDVLITQYNIANIHFQQGNKMEAKNIFCNIYPKLKAILGDNHEIVQMMKRMMCDTNNSVDLIKNETENKVKTLYIKERFFETIENCAIDDVIRYLEICPKLMNSTDSVDRTPLHYAVDSNNIQIVTMLIAKGSNPLLLTKKGSSVLHISANNKNFSITKAIIEYVHKSFNDQYNDFINIKTNKTGVTALHVAAEKNSFEICSLLLQNGAIYNCLTVVKKRPVDYAEDENIKKLFYLIDEIFHYTQNGNDEVLEKLKSVPNEQFQICTKCRNAEKQTLLQTAIINKREAIANVLIKMIKIEQK